MNPNMEIEEQIVELLIPHVATYDARQELMVASWGLDNPLLGDIDVAGAPREFALRLVQKSAAVGRQQGHYPIESILAYIQNLVGVNQQGEITSILHELQEGLYAFDPLQDRQPNEPELVQLPGDLALFIARKPIQGEAYEVFLAANPQYPAPSFAAGWSGRDLRESRAGTAVTGVNMADCAAYCLWLNQTTSRRYRLPSMAELRLARQADTTQFEPELAEWTATPANDPEESIRFPESATRHMLCKLDNQETNAVPSLKSFAYLARLSDPTFTFRVILDMR